MSKSQNQPDELGEILDSFLEEEVETLPKDNATRIKATARAKQRLLKYFEGLIPQEDIRKHAIKGADEGILIGWNACRDQMKANLRGKK